ncbi:MAG TPA: hypothetical protein VJV79_36795 [Polyangiaceae bacterium]|nr:hypothetical protein [Polyangiaceae bacterium]
MVLRYSLGAAMTGNVSAADVAFGKFERDIERFEVGPAWDWFVERTAFLEAELAAAGGFDEQLADRIEETGTFFGPAEVYERHERTEYIGWQIEEVAMAFVVTLQARLNGLRAAANAVYEKASAEDLLTIARPSKLALLPPKLKAVWDVANYVKHNDEWGAELDKPQLVTFDALRELGVASGTHNGRRLARWTTLEALLAISGESCLREAIPGTLKVSVTSGREIAARIQSDFAPLSEGVDAARAAHREEMGAQLNKATEPQDPLQV